MFDQQLKAKIDETNRLARQFNKQNYVDMILKTYQIDPQQARTECKYWMDNHNLVLADLGVLVKEGIEQGKQNVNQIL